MERQLRSEISESDTIMKIISEDSIRVIQMFLSFEHITMRDFPDFGTSEKSV